MKPHNFWQKLGPKRVLLLTLLLGLLIDFMPIGSHIARYLPQVSAIFLIYWMLHRPQWMGIGIAFILGLIMDIGTQAILGQHALAYTVTAFCIEQKRRQIVLYSFGMQAIAVGLLLLLSRLIVATVSLFHHQIAIAFWPMAISSLIAALCWPLLNKGMLSLARYRRIQP